VLTCQQSESLIAIVERIVKNAVGISLLDKIYYQLVLWNVEIDLCWICISHYLNIYYNKTVTTEKGFSKPFETLRNEELCHSLFCVFFLMVLCSGKSFR